MKAFVAGATGFTGREVVSDLCGQGLETFAHVRPDSHRLEEWRQRFSIAGATVETTPWEHKAMTQTFARLRPSIVFCLIGTTRKRGKQASAIDPETGIQDYESVDFGLTELLLNACLEAQILPRFVYLSSIGTGPDAGNAYSQARYKAEEAVRQSGLPYTIARPAIIHGPGRDDSRPMEHVAATLGDSLLALSGVFGARRLQQRYRSISNLELAAALIRIAIDPETVNSIVERKDL